MSAEDKIRNKVEELRGKGKAAVGRATDDPDLEAEGRAVSSGRRNDWLFGVGQ